MIWGQADFLTFEEVCWIATSLTPSSFTAESAFDWLENTNCSLEEP